MLSPWTPSCVIGCMTGTSCDGLDVAAVAWPEGGDGPPQIVAAQSRSLGRMSDTLRAFASGTPLSAAAIRDLDRRLTLLHSEVVLLVRAQCPQPVDLVAVHGQTVYHAPPLSWQMLDLPLLSQRVGLPVVGDLRAWDLACGGQGAPITPLADVQLFPGANCRAVVNIGGFVNGTILKGDRVLAGRDICVGNQLLDAAARHWLQQPIDRDGLCALSGDIHGEAAQELRQLLASQEQGRSLGSGDETTPWLQRWGAELTPADGLATACAGLAQAIMANVARERPRTVWLAGGGVANQRLRHECEQAAIEYMMLVRASDEVGVPATYREAAAMAILGRLCAQRRPITLPQVTHCPDPAPLSGTWCAP